MPYKPVTVDRHNRTIMGVKFDSVDSFDSAASAIGSNMFEGFEPTPKSIEIIRDYITDKISFSQLVQKAKRKEYA